MRAPLPLVLLAVLLGAPWASGDPSGNDDCDLGTDAPDSEATSTSYMRPHICDGAVANGDQDWILFRFTGTTMIDGRADPGVELCWKADGRSSCSMGWFGGFMAGNTEYDFHLIASGTGTYNWTLRIKGQEGPDVPTVACSPSPVEAGEPFSCTVAAMSDVTGVQYKVEWGDGAPPEVSPWVWPGHPVDFTHAYAAPGEHTPRFTATDNGMYYLRSCFGSSCRQPMSATLAKPIHAQPQGADVTTVDRLYRAGLGDVLCIDAGCVKAHAVEGESSVAITLRDDLGLGVAGLLCVGVSCQKTVAGWTPFCGSTEVAVNGGDTPISVRIAEATRVRACPEAAPGTTGAVTFAFR